MKDKKGPGGTLAISPFHEPGDLDQLWNLEETLDKLIPLRSEILDGDLRPLYLAHLSISRDLDHDPDETIEAPVPAGLGDLTDAQCELADLYEISESLVTAAAKESDPLPAEVDRTAQYGEWIAGLPEADKNEWLTKLIGDADSAVRIELREEFRKARPSPVWPTVQVGRTIAQLEAATDEIQAEKNRTAKAKAAKKRAKLLKNMAVDPTPFLRETEEFVARRTTQAYEQSAKLLAELREALADGDQPGLPEEQAKKLKSKNLTRRLLTAALHREGFVPK